MTVYKAIAAVMADLSKTGIGKDQTNTFDKYKFRGIDGVYNALGPLLPKHGLVMLPRILNREVTERTSANGNTLFHTVLEMEFDFIAAEDGSKHTVGPIFGEAMDRGDKSINKAMTAAYKYAIFQAFCIPTEGDNDADAATHEVKPGGDRSGRPDTSNVDPIVANEYARAMADIIAASDPRRAMALHDELNADPAMYTAAADLCGSKAKWKALMVEARKAA
jgi:hypothetical protein